MVQYIQIMTKQNPLDLLLNTEFENVFEKSLKT
jgi:hypothetical protein